MITEDYVSFETAKLLKEKGFDEHTYAYYEDEDNPNISLHGGKAINWNKTEFISKPTLQMAMKWLREIYGIDMSVEINDPLSTTRKYYVVIWGKDGESYILELFESWEIAAEEAIKYCLENLI